MLADGKGNPGFRPAWGIRISLSREPATRARDITGIRSHVRL